MTMRERNTRFLMTVYRTIGVLCFMAVGMVAQEPGAGTITGDAQLTCSLSAPDTIRFVDRRYEPRDFGVYLRLENTGDSVAENVKAYILQDKRFTSVPGSSSIIDFGNVPSGMVIDFQDNYAFMLRVKPTTMDGTDTIKVVVAADGIPAALCTYSVYVEHVTNANLEIQCIPDSRLPMVYDPELNDYAPNPFEVTTVITNTGDGPAYECEVVFIGSREFEPYGQSSVRQLPVPDGKLGPGESVAFTWNIQALLQDKSVADSLTFQVRCKCCLRNGLIYATCSLPIEIPSKRSPEYELTCTSPAALIWDPSTGTFIPDPFVFRVTVENTGDAPGEDITVTPVFSPRVFLGSGEAAVKTIGHLAEGNSYDVAWLMRPIAVPYADSLILCAVVTDRYGISDTCCSMTFIPEASIPQLSLFCEPEYDSLTMNPQTGDYEPENPLEVYLTITNNNPHPVYNVQASVTRGSNDILIVSDAVVDVAQVIQPGNTIGPLGWTVRVKPRTQSGDVEFCFRVTSSNSADRICCVSIYIPEMGRPVLDCRLSRVTEGTDDQVLDFVPALGDYEGEDGGINGNFFTLTASITNVGEQGADRVYARIVSANGGAALLEGESPVKPLSGNNLVPGGIESVSWKLRPVCHSEDRTHLFRVTVAAANAKPTSCEYELTIKGTPKVLEAGLPGDIIGSNGDTLLVPITIGRTKGLRVTGYDLSVGFDPHVIHFVGTVTDGTISGRSWAGPEATLLTSEENDAPDIVRIIDETYVPPETTEEDVLVYLRFAVVFGSERAAWLNYVTSPIRLLTNYKANGVAYSSNFRNRLYGSGCSIAIDANDGALTLGGECIVPLIAGAGFSMAQNAPNPFNPVTHIKYSVGTDSRIRIDVYDITGQHVRTLVNALRETGDYRVIFEASDLPSGIYYCRMVAPGYTHIIQMVLAH